METKNNVVSDKPEKDKVLKQIKNEGTEMTLAKGKGKSMDSFPLIPVGSVIYLEYNLKDNGKIIGIEKKDQQKINAWFNVIGIGGSVTTCEIGDKLILKPTTTVDTFIQDDIDGIPEFKYHVCFEHAILGILK